MSIPKELLKKLEKYPAIISTLVPVYSKPSLPTGYQPKVIDIYCDQRHAIQWVTGNVTHEMDCDLSYKPETIEWFIDGELVCLLVGNDTLFDRLENPIKMPEFMEKQFTQ